MTRQRLLAAVMALYGGAAMEAAAQTPLGTSFTFQGQLNDNGQPANAEYDFLFRLYDAATGGTLISQDLLAGDVPVENGLFSRELDFVPQPNKVLFDGDNRWIEVAVRPGNSGGNYTPLVPRQKLTAAPYATFALGGPGGGGPWAINGDHIYKSNAGDVGIGTAAPESNLHIVDPDFASLRLQEDSDPASYLLIEDRQPTQARFTKYTGAGISLFDIDPVPLDGVSNAIVRVFRHTNTTGYKGMLFFRGDDSVASSAAIGVDGADSLFQLDGGNVGIGTAEPEGKLHVISDTTSRSAGWFDYAGNPDTLGWGAVAEIGGGNAGSAGLLATATEGPASALRASVAFQNGTGRAAWFEINNPLNNSSVVEATHKGVGPAGYFELTRSNNFSSTIVAKTSGAGFAGYFLQSAGGNSGTAILAQALGDQGATVWATAQGAADAVYGYNTGTGGAGFFEIGNENSSAWAVEGLTNGTGVAVEGHTTGNGVAGYFVNRSGSNSRPALYCRTDGTGLAFQAQGVARVEVLEITGADIAEKFPVDSPESAKPGTVMEIDPAVPGRLRVASGEYSPRVAGVVSGANDLSVGAVLGHLPGHEDAPPIALSGRVWVLCDASSGAIEPGDLLTTSSTPGHAMKAADRDRAFGATIGKAMSSLKEGKGLVLVLVSLQ